jgi:hypothetical protein
MKIEGPGRVKPTHLRRPSQKVSDGAGFDTGAEEAREADAPARVRASQPIASVDALLTLQGELDGSARRRRMMGRASEMLDILEGIRLGLLAGSIPRAQLGELVQAVETRREHVDDPNLSSVLDEVELRARVEIAKLQKAS